MMDSPFLSFGRMRHCKTKFGFGEKPTNFFFFFFFFLLFLFFFFIFLAERTYNAPNTTSKQRNQFSEQNEKIFENSSGFLI